MIAARQCCRKLSQQRALGFTLLEVLIALTILAISAIAVISQTGQSLRQQHRLELKNMALWLAENQINAHQIAEPWPSLGNQRSVVEFANQQWSISTQISATNDVWFRKIEVSVAVDSSGLENTLVSLTGYRGRY